MSIRSISTEEFIASYNTTEKAFENVIDDLRKGVGYKDMMALANLHKDLRERLLCTVAAEKVDVTDLCVDPVKVMEAMPALIPALCRVIVDYRTHWRLAQSVFYKRGPFPVIYDEWSRTMVPNGTDAIYWSENQ